MDKLESLEWERLHFALQKCITSETEIDRNPVVIAHPKSAFSGSTAQSASHGSSGMVRWVPSLTFPHGVASLNRSAPLGHAWPSMAFRSRLLGSGKAVRRGSCQPSQADPPNKQKQSGQVVASGKGSNETPPPAVI